jgi:hypothetical protein
MAIVKAPALSLEASGNLGSINYTRHRGKAVARAVVTRVDPNTTLQQTRRAAFGTIATAWSGILSDAQRSAWAAYALEFKFIDRLGQPFTPNGYQIYMRTNLYLVTTGQSSIDDPPILNQDENADRIYLNWRPVIPIMDIWLYNSSGTTVQSEGIQVWRTETYLPVGRRPIEPDWRFLANQMPSGRVQDNTVTTSKRYWYRARTISKAGIVGNWFTDYVDT